MLLPRCLICYIIYVIIDGSSINWTVFEKFRIYCIYIERYEVLYSVLYVKGPSCGARFGLTSLFDLGRFSSRGTSPVGSHETCLVQARGNAGLPLISVYPQAHRIHIAFLKARSSSKLQTSYKDERIDICFVTLKPLISGP